MGHSLFEDTLEALEEIAILEGNDELLQAVRKEREKLRRERNFGRKPEDEE